MHKERFDISTLATRLSFSFLFVCFCNNFIIWWNLIYHTWMSISKKMGKVKRDLACTLVTHFKSFGFRLDCTVRVCFDMKGVYTCHSKCFAVF